MALLKALFLSTSPYVVYDTSVWTYVGYTIQRYIGSATTVGILIALPILGMSLVIGIILRFTGTKK